MWFKKCKQWHGKMIIQQRNKTHIGMENGKMIIQQSHPIPSAYLLVILDDVNERNFFPFPFVSSHTWFINLEKKHEKSSLQDNIFA